MRSEEAAGGRFCRFKIIKASDHTNPELFVILNCYSYNIKNINIAQLLTICYNKSYKKGKYVIICTRNILMSGKLDYINNDKKSISL